MTTDIISQATAALEETARKVEADRIAQHEKWLDSVLPVRKVDRFTNRVRGGRGYLLIDERVPLGTMQEMHTMTCAHCNSVVLLNPKRVRPRGYCGKCHAYVCDHKACNTVCSPFVMKMELGLGFGEGEYERKLF